MRLLILLLSLFLFAGTADAQTKTKKKVKKTHQKHKVKSKVENGSTFACPMHPEVTADKPGKCTKCSMDLKNVNHKNKGEAKDHAYYCPMKCEGEKTYEHKGSCPKCKMDLVKKG